MHEAVVEFFQILVQAGAVPGEDFSCDPQTQAVRLSERGYELLLHAYPEVNWEDTIAPLLHPPMSPASAIEAALGIAFVEALLNQVQRRLLQLRDDQAAWYLQQLLPGVEQRTGLPLLSLLQEHLGWTWKSRLEWLLRQPQTTPCHHWLRDLVLAAGGGEADVQESNGDLLLSDRGLALLSQVWVGDCQLAPVEAGQRR